MSNMPSAMTEDRKDAFRKILERKLNLNNSIKLNRLKRDKKNELRKN